MYQTRESDFVSKHLLNDEYQGNRSRCAHFRDTPRLGEVRGASDVVYGEHDEPGRPESIPH